ncbi:hypothetical protein I7I50_09955 [Histoplasma capsulatum G186AR]|uniref:Uncharacterized protein n=1 Tax=Ajellomyces capsulatus TaxID=5037 RepID=A0A8H7Z337_AJECA|nr:hypothetical protein I7I52_01193 [Histoplasma capsulatum]QSS68847.1 hypothetical protein I7I50_09955 [Histoplasma capsulatum G186AR]
MKAAWRRSYHGVANGEGRPSREELKNTYNIIFAGILEIKGGNSKNLFFCLFAILFYFILFYFRSGQFVD